MADGALSDVRVLDLSDSVAGAYCTGLLADYGADVIKVEPPFEGDPARRAGPFPQDIPHLEKSGLFIHLNGNKRGVTLDIASHDGGEMLRALALKADILVETFTPGYMSTLGLGYQDLEALSPGLVVTSITPFGQTGPYRSYKATDVGTFAMSGRMYIHGHPGEVPLPYAPDVAWYQVGVTAAAATMGALFASRLHGIGQQVDVSAQEALAGNVDNRTLFYAYSGKKTTRARWPGGIPQGAYPCQDGYVVFGVGYDLYFRRLCDAMDRSDIYSDARFATYDARSANAEEFEAIFIGWLMEHTKYEVFEKCQAHRVMCAPLLSFEELMEDPQLKARGFFSQVDHPETGPLPATGAPFKMTATPWQSRRPAPLLGEHNTEIFGQELGYSQEELSRLRAHGVI